MGRAPLIFAAGGLVLFLGCAHEKPHDGSVARRAVGPPQTIFPTRVAPPALANDASDPSASDDQALSSGTTGPPFDNDEPSAAVQRRYEPLPWILAIRACRPADAAAARKHPLGVDPVELGRIVAAVGRLTPGPALCTLEDCGSPCCGGCSFEWVVVPNNDCPGRQFRIWRDSDRGPLRDNGSDCEGRMAAHAEKVLVIGRMGGEHDLILEAKLCRIGRVSGPNDGLDDADYERLMSDHPRDETFDPRRCAIPSPPAPRPPD